MLVQKYLKSKSRGAKVSIKQNQSQINREIHLQVLARNDFLKEEELHEECSANAIKRVLARQLEEEMKQQNLTLTEMAKQMQTSREQLDRLLDPEKTGVFIETMIKAASIVGRQLQIELM